MTRVAAHFGQIGSSRTATPVKAVVQYLTTYESHTGFRPSMESVGESISLMEIRSEENVQKIYIVIPFYNGDEYIDTCLKSLGSGSCAGTEKIIVNNSDTTTDIRRIAAAYEKVTVVDVEPGIGFGRACNEGAKIATQRGAEYIICLNQDTVAHGDLVSELIRPFEESAKLVITAPVSYDYDFLSIEKTFIERCLPLCPDLLYDALNYQVKALYTLNYVSGACFAIRTDFIKKCGLLDPIYFMYFEDDDLCRRIRYLNYDIAVIPGAKVAHFHSYQNGTDEYKSRREKWFRYSRAVYLMKDTRMSLSEALLRLIYGNVSDYMRYILSLRFGKLFAILTSDWKITINMAHIIRSRYAEMELIKRHIRQVQ